MNLSEDDIVKLIAADEEQLIALLSAATYVRDIWKLHLSAKIEDLKIAEEHEFNCHLMLDKVVSKLLKETPAFPNMEVSEFDD